jgi:hypothetical protein
MKNKYIAGFCRIDAFVNPVIRRPPEEDHDLSEVEVSVVLEILMEHGILEGKGKVVMQLTGFCQNTWHGPKVLKNGMKVKVMKDGVCQDDRQQRRVS